MARRRKSSGGRRRPSASAKSPADSDAELFQQALKSHRNGNHARAEALCQRILKRQPSHADSLHLLGIIAGLEGRDEEAAALIEQAVERDEANPACHSNLAAILKDLGRLDDAERHARRAVQLAGGSGTALHNLGTVLIARGRHAEAVEMLRRAVAAAPGHALAHYDLGIALRSAGQIDEAQCALRRALEAKPNNVAAHAALGDVLSILGRNSEAVDFLRRGLELKPRHVPAHINLGNALISLGQTDEAIRHYRTALEIAPRCAPAYYGLVANAGQSVSDEELAGMQTLFADGGVALEDRILLGFSLARALEREGRHDEAFDYARQANDLKKRHYRERGIVFAPQEHVSLVDRIVETFTPAIFSDRANWGVRSDRPVFVVGMPRSGTTLVEQILASHPAVLGAGELADIERMASGLPRILRVPSHYPECISGLDQPLVARLAEQYLRHLTILGPSASRVVDKTTINFLHLGLIALLLPGARIIHCSREPRDICVSCYLHNFSQPGMVFTFDLEHLGLFYGQYERLMAHWRKVLPLDILEVPYEDLVDDQEGLSRKIVDFCGLPWDQRCLEFHRNTRQVKTSSAVQVRRPIYKTSVGRWRNFQRHLGPFVGQLSADAD